MDLKINGKYEEVDFWSFFKFHILSYFAFILIFGGGILLVLFLIGLIFGGS